MNETVPPQGDPEETELAAIRREIDGIDSTLLSLFAQRLQMGDKLAAVKSSKQRLPIRPGREVTMLRRLISEAPAPLERELVVELWRALMAANLRRQRVVEVVVGGGRGDPVRLYDIARRHFGARMHIKDVAEPQAALQRAAESPDSVIAVTTWPAAPGVGAWWPALSESRFHNLQIIAGLPILASTSEPDAAVFAACDAEEAGGDVTMLLAFDPHHRLQRALNEFGFTGREIARAEPRVLVRIEGFVGADDPRAAAMTRAGLDRVRVLGSYARI
jgi:chorismate mutase